MARVIELRELSFAVRDLDESQKKWNEMGFESTPPWREDTVPVQARLTSMPLPNASISLMESSGADTPITKFLEKRGEGIFSFTMWVDDVVEIAKAWQAAGVEWVLPADNPVEVPNGFSVGAPIPLIRGNWTRPSTLNGIVIEIQDFRDEQGNPYDPREASA